MQQILSASKTVFAFITILFVMNSTYDKAQNVSNTNNENVTARLIRYEVRPDYNKAFREAMSTYVLHAQQ